MSGVLSASLYLGIGMRTDTLVSTAVRVPVHRTWTRVGVRLCTACGVMRHDYIGYGLRLTGSVLQGHDISSVKSLRDHFLAACGRRWRPALASPDAAAMSVKLT